MFWSNLMNQPRNKLNYVVRRILASILAITLFVLLLPSPVFAQSEQQRISAVVDDGSNGLIKITPDPPIYNEGYFDTPKTFRIKVENIVGFDWVVYSTGVWLAVNYNTIGQVRVKLVTIELILPSQESGNEKVSLPPHSSATYDVTFEGPGTVSFNADLTDKATYAVSAFFDLVPLILDSYKPGTGDLIRKIPEALPDIIKAVPTIVTLMTDVENCFILGKTPDNIQYANAVWKIVEWSSNDNNLIALLNAISNKLKLGWDAPTIGTMTSKIRSGFLVKDALEVINNSMIFIGEYALGNSYGSVVITGSNETPLTSTTTIPSTSRASTTVPTSIVTSSSPTSFTIPQLVAPNDGITLPTNQNTTFRWSNTGATRYKFEVWNDTNKMNYSFDVTGTSTQFTPVSEGSWRWQVRSYSSNGQAGDAPYTRSFKVVSVPSQPSSGIALYDGPNYTGPFIVLTMGKYSNLADYSWSDRIESIRFLGDYSNNYHVVLYSEKDFSGDPGHYDADASTLGNAQQNHVRSVEIYRKTPGSGIELYDGQNFSGTCVFLPVAYPEGKYADLTTVGFWDRAESIKFVGDCAGGKCHAVLFSEKDFQGDPAHFDNDATTLPNAQQNHVRSVSLYMHQPPGPPTNPNPASGTVLDKISNSLDVSFDADGDEFQIHVWGNNFDRTSDWDASRSVHLDGLVPGQTYYWQAQGKNNIGVSPLSPQWSFTTAPLPTPPTPVTPPALTTTSSALMTWNTFLGGSAVGHNIAVDGKGSVYVTGYSDTAWGNPVRAYTANREAFVAKLDSGGNLIWNTFLGGSGWDYGSGIAVDVSGNVYVTGLSNATWGSPVRAYTANNDAFVAKLDSGGNLIWNTFLGGIGYEEGHGIAVDDGGNVYIVGGSDATWGSPVRVYTAGGDAFAARIDRSGNLIWSTFLGGNGLDEGNTVAVDGSGNVYVAGASYATWGSPVRAYTAGLDAFAAKLSGSGTLTWNSFLGGSGNDRGWGIAADSSGNVYVAGYSETTWGSPVRAYTAGQDAFAVKLDSRGSPTWNTFLGGSADEIGNAIAVDSGGNVYIAGTSNATWGSPVRAYTASTDGFAVGLTSKGNLVWNTFLGGHGDDLGTGIALDSDGNVYVAGYSTASWGTPVRAYTCCDAFLAKLGSNSAP